MPIIFPRLLVYAELNTVLDFYRDIVVPKSAINSGDATKRRQELRDEESDDDVFYDTEDDPDDDSEEDMNDSST